MSAIPRLESVALVAGNAGLDDMLDNEEQLAEQMDALPYLVRFQYDKSAAYVAGLFEPLAERYKAVGVWGQHQWGVLYKQV